MNAILERILSTGTVEDDQGSVLPLHSNILAEGGARISEFIRRHEISRTLEVGCAFGISSLYICEATSKQVSPHHIAIDPNQSTEWHNIGVRNLREAGFKFWELIEEPSEFALPDLLRRGVKVQLALIDGWHTFDKVMVDFFYIDRLLEDGGIVVFDDVNLAPVNRAVRYVSNYPNYRFLEAVRSPASSSSRKRRALDLAMRGLIHVLPTHIQAQYFDASWLASVDKMRLGGRLAFLMKCGPDTRDGMWYKHF